MKKKSQQKNIKNHYNIKIAGKRKPPQGGLEAANNLLKLAIDLRGDKPFIPKGVYRFKTHEEKDKWILKMMTR